MLSVIFISSVSYLQLRKNMTEQHVILIVSYDSVIFHTFSQQILLSRSEKPSLSLPDDDNWVKK